MRNSGPPPDSAARVRAAVAVADRLRRSRDRRRRAWRAAPYVAALSLCGGLIGGMTHWPGLVGPAMLAAGFLVLITYACMARRRPRTISDGLAAAIDRDAGLHDELRSAAWFATRETRDGWTDFHVDRAADRIASVDWPRLYPSPANRAAQLTTGGIAIATLLLPVALPGLSGVLSRDTDARRADRAVSSAAPVAGVPVGVPKELDALLASVESGTFRVESPAQAAALRDLLAKLAQLHGADLKQLARAMTPQTDAAHTRSAEAVMKALADRVQRAAENAAAPPPLRDALETLSDDLSQAAETERMATHDPRQAMPAESPQDGNAVQTNASAKADETSIQVVRDADAGGGAAVLMVADPNGSGSDPGSGLGGGSGAEAQKGRMAAIADALRRETVEANANTEGADALTDLRRKSERGQATVAFTGSGARTFETGRVSGPPAVPEARRAAVQSYFVRQ